MSILSAIGNTPLVELNKLNSKKPKVRIFGKLEGTNPGGSIKDRPAYWMVKKAEESGRLTKGKIILEPTSGNTGIALAFVAAARGYKLILTMPDTMSVERRNLLKAYGAQLVLTPGAEGMKGALAKAEELVRQVPVHRPELCLPCRRGRHGAAQGADPVHEAD
jgi:cysteine synthase